MVPPPRDPRLDGLVEALRAAGAGSIRAILLYGSHVQASEPDRFSAYDLIVVVDRYRRFYEGLRTAGLMGRSPALVNAWSHVLVPTSVSVAPRAQGDAVGKCQIVSDAHFRAALGPRAKDHFLKGRTVQRLSLVWARGDREAAAVMDALRIAREDTARWVGPTLAAPFTAETYAETMLRVSYAAEIRPETGNRVRDVFRAQRETLIAIATQAIDAAIGRGEIVRVNGAFTWTRPPGRGTRLLMSAYFARSKARATARWIKHLATYEDWPFYIVRKLERRAGLHVEVTERERRWPFIFLWPKLVRVLRELNRVRRLHEPPGGTTSP